MKTASKLIMVLVILGCIPFTGANAQTNNGNGYYVYVPIQPDYGVYMFVPYNQAHHTNCNHSHHNPGTLTNPTFQSPYTNPSYSKIAPVPSYSTKLFLDGHQQLMGSVGRLGNTTNPMTDVDESFKRTQGHIRLLEKVIHQENLQRLEVQRHKEMLNRR